MDHQVRFSIPPKTGYLRAVARCLNEMADVNEGVRDSGGYLHDETIHASDAPEVVERNAGPLPDIKGIALTATEIIERNVGTPAEHKVEAPEAPEAPDAPDAPDAPEAPEAPPATTDATVPAEITEAFKGAEPNLNAVELDSKGRPWDARIHTKSQKKVKATGEWKLIPGINNKNPGLVTQVINELDGKLTPVTTQAGGAAELPKTPAAGADASQGDKNVIFMAMMQVITGLTTPPAGETVPKVGIEAITAIANKHGAANIPALLQMPIEAINAVKAEVDALCLTLQ